MNRHGSPKKQFGNPWANEFKSEPVFFWGTGLSFLNTGSDLFYAGAMLSKLSGQTEPLIWSKRLAYRYVETRNPTSAWPTDMLRRETRRQESADSSSIRARRPGATAQASGGTAPNISTATIFQDIS